MARGGGHLVCVIITQYVRKSIDMSLTLNWIDLMVFSLFLFKKIIVLH